MQMHSIFIEEIERLKRLLIGMGMNHDDGEDILQDVYLEAMQRPPKYGNPEEKARWLMRVTVNKCTLLFRQRRLNTRVEKEFLQQSAEYEKIQLSPDCDVITNEETQAIKNCLNGMDESLKVPLVMKYFCGLNASQISDTLKLKSGTVRKRLFQGRVILAEMLSKKGIEP
ncbi:MAG: RNA polymerase sigma factor [Sedimentisphaerales bacterium]|nr:RNA polymerase sigma factor [Sedimentisphaerales bacterium]